MIQGPEEEHCSPLQGLWLLVGVSWEPLLDFEQSSDIIWLKVKKKKFGCFVENRL